MTVMVLLLVVVAVLFLVVVMVLVMTMMAIVAVIVAVIIVMSGSGVVRGRGSLVGTRAFPGLLHYCIIQSILGFLREVLHCLILAVYREVTITTAIVARDLRWWDHRRRRVRHHRRRRHVRRLHRRRGSRRVWRWRWSTTGRGGGMSRVRIHDLAVRLVRVSWSCGRTVQEVGVNTAVTGPQRGRESVTVRQIRKLRMRRWSWEGDAMW